MFPSIRLKLSQHRFVTKLGRRLILAITLGRRLFLLFGAMLHSGAAGHYWLAGTFLYAYSEGSLYETNGSASHIHLNPSLWRSIFSLQMVHLHICFLLRKGANSLYHQQGKKKSSWIYRDTLSYLQLYRKIAACKSWENWDYLCCVLSCKMNDIKDEKWQSYDASRFPCRAFKHF